MKLIDFKDVPIGCDDSDFVEKVKQVIPLDDLRNLTEDEALNLFGAVGWLSDYLLLLCEFHQTAHNSETSGLGAPLVPSFNGPFIDTMLTRENDSSPDFRQLEHFGLKP